MTPRTTSERIADAALAILIAEGSSAVTMRRVAADVGITAMAIYKHYPNRDDLLRAITDAAFAKVGASWGQRQTGDDWLQVAFGVLDDFLDFALRQPNLYHFLITDRRSEARQFTEGFGRHGSPTFSHAMRLVEEGIRAGVLRDDDVLEVALCITGPMQGLVQLYHGGRIGLSEDDFRSLCRRTIGRIIDGIKA